MEMCKCVNEYKPSNIMAYTFNKGDIFEYYVEERESPLLHYTNLIGKKNYIIVRRNDFLDENELIRFPKKLFKKHFIDITNLRNEKIEYILND